MPIELPRFASTDCLSLTACGDLHTEDPQILGKLKELKTRIVDYEPESGKKVFLRGYFGGRSGTHLHIDCRLSSYFRPNDQPETNGTLSEVLSDIALFEGISAYVSVVGCFEVEIAELPDQGMIRTLSKQQNSGDITIRLAGGRIALTGAPIEEIEWDVLSDGKRARIIVNGELREVVDEKYLMRLMEWIENQYQLFVKGRTSASTKD